MGVVQGTGRPRRLRYAGAAFVAVLSGAMLAAVAVAPAAVAAGQAPRVVMLGTTCPGVDQEVAFEAFPPGSYTLSSAYVTFSPDAFTVRADGTITPAVYARIDDHAPTTFKVDATSTAPGSSPYPAQWTLAAPSLNYDLYASAYQISGECFAPGDSVDISIGGVASSQAPSSAVANADGDVSFGATLTATSTRADATVTATDAATGRTGTETVPVPATTMTAGHSLTSADIFASEMLYSPNMTYRLDQYGCTSDLTHFYTANGTTYSPTVWWAGTGSFSGSCALRMLATGDLVLDDTASGKQLWHTGTESTGSANRLVVQNDGNLVVDTSAGHPVWSRTVGLICGPNGYLTRLSISSVRSGSWVGIGGVIKEFNINGALVPAIGRRVDLERKVGTGWSVIGTATPDSTGRLWFSMRQPLASYYRWYVPATRDQTSAVSLSTRR